MNVQDDGKNIGGARRTSQELSSLFDRYLPLVHSDEESVDCRLTQTLASLRYSRSLSGIDQRRSVQRGQQIMF